MDTSAWHAIKEALIEFSGGPDIGDIKTTLNHRYILSIVRI